MHAGTPPCPASLESAADADPAVRATLCELSAQLSRDALDLLALEGRAAALTLALIVFFAVAAACCALLAWFALGAIGVLALVQSGYSPVVAVAALAAASAGLGAGCGLLVRGLAKSVLPAAALARRAGPAPEPR
jgi:hypothetical protein